MSLPYEGKSFEKIDIEIYDYINKRKDNVRYFIVENVDRSSINLNHKVKNEVDEVLLVPINDLLRDLKVNADKNLVKVRCKNNPEGYVELEYSHRVYVFLSRIRRKFSNYQDLFDSMFLDKGTYRKSFSKQNNSKAWRRKTKVSSYNPNDSSYNPKDSSYTSKDSSYNSKDSRRDTNDNCMKTEPWERNIKVSSIPKTQFQKKNIKYNSKDFRSSTKDGFWQLEATEGNWRKRGLRSK